MSHPEILRRYGLAFHPFRPGVPTEALWTSPPLDAFCRRVTFALTDGGFVLITGEPGTGKSAALRLLAHRLAQIPELSVGVIAHPQSRVTDFYRELGERFSVPLNPHNRWSGFKSLRQTWSEHIQASLKRPVLIIDEAQEMLSSVLNEIRILSSRAFDSEALLCVIFAGDARLTDRFRSPELRPLGSRIRRRLRLDYAERDTLSACLDHLLEAAGNASLMSTELKVALAEHAAGNFRVLMNLADELLAIAHERELAQLDEALFFDVFKLPPPKTAPRRKKT